METNMSDVNNLDSEVLLPPRKRLLAGLKKQNPDLDTAAALGLSSSACSSDVITARLNNLLGSDVSDRNISLEELNQVSRSAAAEAARAAEAASITRSVAEEKAAIAVKAIAAAKSALDLVVSFSEGAAGKERSPRKNKMKKHVPVQQLYKKHQKTDNNEVDEELARKLHRAINSSPRICSKISSSDMTGQKSKKVKGSLSGRSRVPNGVVLLEGHQHSVNSSNAKAGEVGAEGLNQDLCNTDAHGEASIYNESGQLVTIDGEAGDNHSKEKTLEETSPNGKKKGRVKLKKLPLSICNDRDQANPKSEMFNGNPPLAEENSGSPPVDSAPLSLREQAGCEMTVEATSTWKCQDFTAQACVDKNKVM